MRNLNRTKRSIVIIITAVILLCAVGCQGRPSQSNGPVGSTPKPGVSSSPKYDYDKIIEITWLRVADEPLSEEVLEYLLLNFGLKVNEKYFPSQNMEDKILEMYVSGMIPDITTGISAETAKKLKNKGYLLNLANETEALSNYFALWNGDASAWKYTKKEIGATDDGLYCIVPVNRRTSTGWIYNKTVFEREGIAFPSTLEELYKALTTYKEAHSASSVLWTNRYESRHLEALLNAYGLTNEAWQTDEYGDVFYLYSKKEWYRSLEWLSKFIKLGVVPSEDDVIKEYTDSEYASVTSAGKQIIEYTDTYNYMYIQNAQKRGSWSLGESMVAAEGYTPVMLLNTPYIDEATCISSEADTDTVNVLLALINWLCSDEGNLWTNFGIEGDSYTVNNDGEIVFIKYYSDEVTPDIDPDSNKKVSDCTLGRMYTTVPWDSVNVYGYTDRYTEQEEYLDGINARFTYKTVFCESYDVLEDKTELWKYNSIRSELERLTKEFEEYTLEHGFSDYYWDKYYNSLVEAGLNEYTAHMQERKLR